MKTKHFKVACIFIALLSIILSCSKKVEINYIEKQSIISNNGKLSAVVLKNSLNNNYHIGIKSKNNTLLIIENFKIPLSYHEPFFKIIWNKSDDQIIINIDHDFGENNIKYIYDVKEYSLKK